VARILLTLVAASVVATYLPDPTSAAEATRPPVIWLRGEGNFTKAHRSPTSIRSIVIHVTEGAFWGTVQWLQNPRAHASSHFIVARSGKIIQLVHVSDIAWHAGNWKTNVGSVGIEHEGFTYGPGGFTVAQYESSARLTAWLARRALMPIDREHIIGHAEVPAPRGGMGGSGHHTDPGPHWNWPRYMALVRRYALGVKLSVVTRLRPGPLRGIVPWHATTTGGVRSVEFVVDGRVVWTDRRPLFSFAGGRGLNTTRLANGAHALELRAYGAGTRHDVTRRTVVVDNRAFRLTTAGARDWTRVRGTVRVHARAWGARARAVVLRIDGRLVARDAHAPYVFRWNTRRAKDRKHVLELEAHAVDGRVATRRIALVVRNRPLKPAQPAPTVPPLGILRQSVTDGQELGGLVLWRVSVQGRVERVRFTIDGTVRGTDLADPFTLGWDTSVEAPGPHVLSVRAFGAKGKTASATLTVTVAERQASGDTAAP
jgi:hypothetical protein